MVTAPTAPTPDLTEARRLFPATRDRAYLNTAAVGLASSHLADTYHRLVDRWTAEGFDFPEGERAADAARSAVARLIGADASDVALIPSLSSVAGLVGAQLPPAEPGANVVIGAREYSSNNFPWRQLEAKGYDVRQVPFRNGGLEADDVAEQVDSGTKVVAFSGVQSSTGHRSDVPAISAIARAVGAIVFVDGSQMIGALPVADLLPHVDVLAVLRPQVPAQRRARHGLLLPLTRGAGTVHADQRRLAGGQGAVRELLRAGDGPLPHRVALRQLHQLAGRGRQRGGAPRLRRPRGRTRCTRATWS